ncbi:hypothetical protein BLNAU_745 [Blattamonas nauphoetae]|uniref:Uncharacterized protein n=1 Tax=Blattamonas nauphoetae TaxID=2049346 RepID=A0ABQ9YKD1_9EUKA|nr:hypothetical protein BLNAU_745 [Blattamonas nauphoetae]
MSKYTDWLGESGRRSSEQRQFSRPYSNGPLVGNWFENYSQTNRALPPESSDPLFRTTSQEQNKYIERKYSPTMERTFVSTTNPEPFPKSTAQDTYTDPTMQKTREFRSQRSFNTNLDKQDHYVDRWTNGVVGDTQNHATYRSFWKKQ